jgi:hypothetical protein
MIMPGLPFGLSGARRGPNELIRNMGTSSLMRAGDIGFVLQAVENSTTTPPSIPAAFSGWTTLNSGSFSVSATSTSGTTNSRSVSYRTSYKVITSADIGTTDTAVARRCVIRNTSGPSVLLTASTVSTGAATSGYKSPVSVVLYTDADASVSTFPTVNGQAVLSTQDFSVTLSVASGGSIDSEARRFYVSFYEGDFYPNTLTLTAGTSGTRRTYFAVRPV